MIVARKKKKKTAHPIFSQLSFVFAIWEGDRID